MAVPHGIDGGCQLKAMTLETSAVGAKGHIPGTRL